MCLKGDTVQYCSSHFLIPLVNDDRLLVSTVRNDNQPLFLVNNQQCLIIIGIINPVSAVIDQWLYSQSFDITGACAVFCFHHVVI